MSNWFHRFFNPHCSHCAEERICQSCEVLKQQVEAANYQNNRLMDRLLEKPAPEVPRAPMEITKPVNIPWNVRKQMLEAEDREKAKLMREAPKPIQTEDLEKELDIVSQTRERESATK